jgi:nitrite reductase/ring-hydroxylating ferredoxin subunit/Fe-S cluster biogenesis protein NfuA
MNPLNPAPIQRPDLSGFVGEIERLEAIFEQWEDIPRDLVGAYRMSIEALNGEAVRRLVRVLKAEPAAVAAMKTALADEVVYAVLRRHEIIKPSLTEKVEAALRSIRPMLKAHGGDVELVTIDPPSIEVRFIGACDGCAASALTFHAGVKKAIEDACPEISEVRQAKGRGGGEGGGARFVSPFSIGSDAWLFAGWLDDIPQDGLARAELNGETVVLYRRDAIVRCFRNACAHLGLPLDGGQVENGVLTCPHHDFSFDLASGDCLTTPAVSLQAHAVRVTDGRVEVRLSS